MKITHLIPRVEPLRDASQLRPGCVLFGLAMKYVWVVWEGVDNAIILSRADINRALCENTPHDFVQVLDARYTTCVRCEARLQPIGNLLPKPPSYKPRVWVLSPQSGSHVSARWHEGPATK